jgi:hypothetical protein
MFRSSRNFFLLQSKNFCLENFYFKSWVYCPGSIISVGRVTLTELIREEKRLLLSPKIC